MIFPGVLLLLSPLVFLAVMTTLRLLELEQRAMRLTRSGSHTAETVGWLAFHRVAFLWFFRAPTWVQDDPEARRLLRRLRIYTALWNVGVLVAFAIQMARTGMHP
jgi:hypothetical protein